MNCTWAPCLQAVELPQALQAELKKIGIPQSAMGLQVIALGNEIKKNEREPTPWLSLNVKQPMNPASTMKLLTSFAALDLLGPTFTWKTRIYIRGILQSGILDGDLIIEGGGDPQLVLENFWLFLRKVRAAGIHEIRGNVILDHHLFAEQKDDPADFDDAPLKPYNVLPDALLLNYQSVHVNWRADLEHKKVKVDIDPILENYSITPPLLVTEKNCGDWRSDWHLRIQDQHLFFDGIYPEACGEENAYLHIHPMKNTEYFGAVFRSLWKEQGGLFKGEVIEGLLPASSELLTEWESKPLALAIYDLNKFSNNVMARHLFLTLAAQNGQIPATTEFAKNIVAHWLDAQNINTAGLVLENGSGLSRMERITPLTMSQLLIAAYHSRWMPEFISSLPIVGLDGSMRKRLTTQTVATHAHIKTGSLKDTKAIAGYVKAMSGKLYVVVCFINHPWASRAQPMQDLLLQWVYENG